VRRAQTSAKDKILVGSTLWARERATYARLGAFATRITAGEQEPRRNTSSELFANRPRMSASIELDLRVLIRTRAMEFAVCVNSSWSAVDARMFTRALSMPVSAPWHRGRAPDVRAGTPRLASASRAP
jgi:hypothetical protein